ncbi:hypothetical protein [Variovorax sp. PAMC26660]|uniref:hypothetical protein n=1 Tax=Variovorax sp. PAMC26660 TaxID=2762322 RepID=UPI00164EC1E1|nr:hypothetical protein [Variovorax sp. PAMC26660]QNK66155.1 hypothetical protein H7F35_23550 [Variovorax sp. PAMC26660]
MINFWSSLLRRLSRQGVLVFASSFIIHLSASAGYAGGPYVVWVNLDHSFDGERIDSVVADFVASNSINCDGQWKSGDSLLYMKKRPPLIDDDLVRKVFLKRDAIQRKYLSDALRKYSEIGFRHYDGLDGIVVYSNQGVAKMMSLTTKKKEIQSVVLASRGNRPMKKDVEDAFCALLPPITRAP